MASLLTQIKVRKDIYENIKDLVLAQGEPGFAHDTGDYAVGDGTNKFSDICFKLQKGITNNGTSTDNAIARFDGTTGRVIQDSTATISDDGHLFIDTTSDTTMTTPAIKVLHTGPVNGSSYADLMELAGYEGAPYGFKFRTYGDGTAIIQSQRIRGGSEEKFSLSLNPDGGDVLIGGKVIQGTKNTDSTIASMNQFTSDLYVKGDGSAPNSPKVAGFYLGKSAGADENRHMDIVTGSTVSYIDFNRAGTVRDYDVRLRVNNSTGDVHFQWSGDYAATQKVLKADDATFEAAKIVKTGGADTHILLAGGGTKPISDFATGGNIKVKANDVLAITTDNELSTKYTNAATTTVDVGGLSKGTNVDGWSLKQIIDKLLYKYQPPSVGSLTISGSQNNDYIGGTATISTATITVSAGSTTPSMKNSSLSWNGETYTGNNAGSAFTAFSSKTITFTINKTWTSTATDTTFEQLTGTATISLTGGKEDGTDWSTTKTGKNSIYYFDRSEYYWGSAASATGTAYNKDNTGNNTQRNKLGSGAGTALTAVLNNQVFTVVLPKKWGTTLKVYDGASNPVTGVFKNAGEVTIKNKNNYNETYIVWKGAAATGTIKYFFQIS